MAEPKRRGRPPSGRPKLPMLVSIRGTPEYGDWLARFAAAGGESVAELVDTAVASLAKRRKFEPPPPRVPGA